MLIAERQRTLLAEEVGLQYAPRRPLAEHRPGVEREVDARVAHIAVGEESVGRVCDLGGVLCVLPLPERAELVTVGEESGAYETRNGERLPLPELDHLSCRLLGRGGSCSPEDGRYRDGEPEERCHSDSHDIPRV